jgi:hypothetical protein
MMHEYSCIDPNDILRKHSFSQIEILKAKRDERKAQELELQIELAKIGRVQF